MAKFTQREIEEEHRRRRGTPEIMIGKPNARCIHCGQPFDAFKSVAGEYGLCDDCTHKD